MKRVTGIGGIFFKAKDAPSLRAWYKQHLGIDVQAWAESAFYLDLTPRASRLQGTTAWTVFKQESDYLCSEPRLPSWSTTGVDRPPRPVVKVFEQEEGCNVLEKNDEIRAWKVCHGAPIHRGQQGRAMAAASRPMSELVRDGAAPS